MIIKWLVNYLRENYGIYSIDELQTWGHCGLCGKAIKGEIFPKDWSWGICKECKKEDIITI